MAWVRALRCGYVRGSEGIWRFVEPPSSAGESKIPWLKNWYMNCKGRFSCSWVARMKALLEILFLPAP